MIIICIGKVIMDDCVLWESKKKTKQNKKKQKKNTNGTNIDNSQRSDRIWSLLLILIIIPYEQTDETVMNNKAFII